MTKPIILFVDDEPPVLNALERDLRQHYGSDYRIVKAGSGFHALQAVKQFKQRNDPIALFIVDERMPEMTGTALLAEVIQFYPDARRVLLTAYADTKAAIAGINTLGLDYYFQKPWDPPEEKLFPILDDLLSKPKC
jgi:thioredoxin reductase (NADPH)